MFFNMPIERPLINPNEADRVPSGFVLSEEHGEVNYYDHLQKKRQQNIALVVLGVISCAVIFLGIFQMRNIIAIPLPPSEGGALTAKNSTAELSSLDDATLKAQDTDADGLSDYDEIRIYNTSPYLSDSDSDDVSDFDEVAKGTDPNCPIGQTCFNSSTGASQTAVAPVNSLTFEQFRALLLTTGQYTRQQVDALSDADLNQIYVEMQAQNPALADKLSPDNDKSAGGSTAVTTEQIRQMLRDQGMDDASISKVDDATLMRLYEEALSEASNSTAQK